MRSPGRSVPITTRLVRGAKPSRCGTIASSASGESARSGTGGGSAPVPGGGDLPGAWGLREAGGLPGMRGVVTRGECLSHDASVWCAGCADQTARGGLWITGSYPQMSRGALTAGLTAAPGLQADAEQGVDGVPDEAGARQVGGG